MAYPSEKSLSGPVSQVSNVLQVPAYLVFLMMTLLIYSLTRSKHLITSSIRITIYIVSEVTNQSDHMIHRVHTRHLPAQLDPAVHVWLTRKHKCAQKRAI